MAKKKQTGKSAPAPFVNKQLEESGLTFSDVMAKVYVDGSDKPTLLSPFRAGGIDRMGGKGWEPNTTDNEMLIYYYDRFGNLRTTSINHKIIPYVRIRYSDPESHLVKMRPMKYQSPPASEVIIYIPQMVRDLYLSQTEIDTLVIQEGEKKAEKACKHGIPSVAIQGILNSGNIKSGIDKELKYLCEVLRPKNVVFLMDSDFEDLSKHLKEDDEISTRPESFAGAVIKFRQYIKSINTFDYSADAWFAHINKTESEAKGIDDLLCSDLKGKEADFKKDLDAAMSAHDGKGEWVSVYKISTLSDYKIKDIWLLNDDAAFLQKHKSELESIPSFTLHRIPYEWAGAEIVHKANSKYKGDLWSIQTSDSGKKTIEFHPANFLDFLEDNGFATAYVDDSKEEIYYIYTTDGVRRVIRPREIRSWAYQFVKQVTKSKPVHNKFVTAHKSFLSDSTLELLPRVDAISNPHTVNCQLYHYGQKTVELTPRELRVAPRTETAWEWEIIDRDFERVPMIKAFYMDDNKIPHVDFTEQALESDFVQFIIRASTILNREGAPDVEINTPEFLHRNIANKITVIGYFLTQARSKSDSYFIVAQDWTISSQGKACGGSGKSMLGQALGNILRITTLDCKQSGSDDNFMFDILKQDSRVVVFDDIKPDFSFKSLYNVSTGDLTVNPKGGRKFVVPFDKSPKIYISSNYPVKDDSDSTERRLAYASFSNYFSKDRTPYQVFHHNLFDDWDARQWLLFDNFMMECIHFYMMSRERGWGFKAGSGLIQPPMQQLNNKRYTALIPLPFREWADVYFSPESNHLNIRIDRNDMFADFRRSYSDAKSVSSAGFKRFLIYYCKLKRFDLNRTKKNSEEGPEDFESWRSSSYAEHGSFIGERISSNSKEYFIVSQRDAKIDP